ncbi:MAG: hypothetical protein RL215_2308, partial [Planctomycetota bacterium]
MPDRLIRQTPKLQPEDLLSATGKAAAAALYRTLLLDDCLPFWFPRCVDQDHGGYLHCVDRDGTVVDSDKSIWAQGRMAWMLLTLAQTPQLAHDPRRSDWLSWAESGLQFLLRHGFSGATDEPTRDSTRGQMYFHVTRDGRPIRRRRYVYSESFAAIAFARHAAITNNQQSASLARSLFDTFVDSNFTPGRIPPKFSQERPLIGLAPRMITLVTAHELQRTPAEHPSQQLWIDRCINEIRTLFYKPDISCVM